MTDWIEHTGGPQPVADDDVWVQLRDTHDPDPLWHAEAIRWKGQQFFYRVLNQHLIDAARLEGIRLGLEAAWHQISGHGFEQDRHMGLDPATIAREAVLDKLASEAQEQGMGYEKEADQ